MTSPAELPSPVMRLVRDLARLEIAGPVRPDPSVVVRTSGPLDQPAWLEIQNDLLIERGMPRCWDEGVWRRELTSRPWWSPDRLLLAHLVDDPTPLGCVAVELDPGAGWAQLHWLAVRTQARRRGIATRLLDEAERLAVASRCRQLRVETLRNWTAAVKFYLARGFGEVSWADERDGDRGGGVLGSLYR